VVESTWMGLGLHIKQQLQQVRRAPAPRCSCSAL